MPRARGDKEYVLPTKGLNTESNLLHFPQEFSPDLLNMEIDYNPQLVRPRKGVNLATLARLVETRNSNAHNIAITSFLWEGANRDSTINFVVLQVGRYLYLFDDTNTDDPTAAIHSERIDLNLFLSGTVKGTLANVESNRVNFANVKGKLLICSGAVDPILLDYDGTTLTSIKVSLTIRDILGIEDGLEVDENPSTLSDDHRYNLYNQGWYKQRRLTAGSKTESDPIAEYNTQWAGEYPSNADVVWLGMVDDTGDLIFDAELLRDLTFGSTPAARGHYVVDAFNIDRNAIIALPQESRSSTGGSNPSGGGGFGTLPPSWIYVPPIILP